MKRALLITIVLLALLPDVVKAQWTFDVVSVDVYKRQARSIRRTRTLSFRTTMPRESRNTESSTMRVSKREMCIRDRCRYSRRFGC